MQRQISCANIIDGKKNCYKSTSKSILVTLRYAKYFYGTMICMQNNIVLYSQNSASRDSTSREYRKIIFSKFSIIYECTVHMCKVTTMCRSNPTHHPGMHSHNVWYGQMCTVIIMRNLCKKLYYITVNLSAILRAAAPKTYTYT